MALPQPTYPPVTPSGFQDIQQTLTQALALYAKYHPAAFQQRMYQSILESETWESKADLEKMRIFANERAHILNNIARLENAKIRGSSYYSGRARGGTRGGGVNDVAMDLAKLEVDRLQIVGTHDLEAAAVFEDRFTLDRPAQKFIHEVKKALDIHPAINRSALKTALADAWSLSLKSGLDIFAEDGMSQAQRRLMAGRLYTDLRARKGFEQLDKFAIDPITGQSDPDGVAAAIDNIVGSGFVTAMVADGRTPAYHEAEERKQWKATSKSPASGLTAEELYLRAQGAVPQPVAGAAQPGAAGVAQAGTAGSTAAPTGDAEALFRDRLAQLDVEIAGLRGKPSPSTRAARRSLGWEGQVPPDALAAATSVHPLAGESLGLALDRVRQGGGTVTPTDDVEAWTQSFIETNPAQDFGQFVQELFREYQNGGDQKRASAYWGAFYYSQNAKTQTFNEATRSAEAPVPAPVAQEAWPEAEYGLLAEEFMADRNQEIAAQEQAEQVRTHAASPAPVTLQPSLPTVEVGVPAPIMSTAEEDAAVRAALMEALDANDMEAVAQLAAAAQLSELELLKQYFPGSMKPTAGPGVGVASDGPYR